MAQLKRHPKIGIITQARMTSTRLPGKVLLQVNGKSMLDYHIHRLLQLHVPNCGVAIATTTNKEDDELEEYARKNQLPYYRGSEYDVLDRFHKLKEQEKFDIVCRVTSDCPFIDPSLIEKGLEAYLAADNDMAYVSNCFPRTYARGFDFEIFSSAMLDEAYHHGHAEEDREHVTPYVWKNKPGHFQLLNISQENQNGQLRITLDTPEDFELIKKLIVSFHAEDKTFSEIENILLTHPELVEINAHIEQKKN